MLLPSPTPNRASKSEVHVREEPTFFANGFGIGPGPLHPSDQSPPLAGERASSVLRPRVDHRVGTCDTAVPDRVTLVTHSEGIAQRGNVP